MEAAITFECQRDFFKFKKFAWAVPIANIIPISAILIRIWSHNMTAIHIDRAAVMYILKAIVQFVTIVPAVDGTDQCINRGLLGIVLNFGNCADMMFSGHTAMTYIMAPDHYKWIFIIPVAITLVLGEMHYTSDIIIGIVVASWITKVICPSEQQREQHIHTKIRLIV